MAEDRTEFYQRLQSILSGSAPFNSPETEKIMEEFLVKSTDHQRAILGEIMRNNPQDFIPLAQYLLNRDENLGGLIIDALTRDGNEGTARLLSTLAEEIGKKSFYKLVKKAFYQLRLKGIVCPELKGDEAPVFKKISLPKPEAYISHIDSAGDRLLILALPESLQFSAVYSFVINDQNGIRDVRESFIKKNDFLSYLKGDNSQTPITIVDIDYLYAQYLLHCAYQINVGSNIPLPSHFTARHKTLFQPAPDFEKPLIYNTLQREAFEHNTILPDHASDLFKTPEIQNWLVDEQSIAEYTHKIEHVKTSSLIVSTVAQEERIESLIAEATRGFFTPERCALYKRRLEESAYIFLKTNREREAEISMAVGHSLVSDSAPVETQLFPREMVRRSLSARREDNQDSPIILPNQRLIS